MEDILTQERREWVARPVMALTLRAAIVIVPIVAVTVTAWQIHLALGPPDRFIDGVARWVALSAGCTVSIRLLDRVAKRLLPLTVLLRMTIVFPDDVPSRFRVAMRYGTTRQLARDLKSGELAESTPQAAAEKLLSLVAQLSSHDRATRGHTERVRAYADLVAEELGFSEQERHKLHWAGLLHDIGKLAVPAAVLNKAGPLSESEWAHMRTHPNEGWTIVQPLVPWLGEWAEATRDHHERWDGAGYPRGLAGSDISRSGRIIAVVDAFDVMTSPRSYKQPISFDQARSELASSSGSHFDPEVVRAFLAVALTRPRSRWSLFSWLANSPIVTSVTSGTASVPATVVTGMAVATVAAGSMVTPLLDEEPAGEVAVERVAPAQPTTTIAPTTTAPTTTAASAATTTTAPPPTTTVPITSPPSTTPPTTTSAPPPSTTTTPAPATIASIFLGGGAGDVLSLVDSVAGGTTTNIDGDANPGITIERSTGGLIEIDDPNVYAWGSAIEVETPMEGPASLRVHAAIEGYQDGFGVLLVGLVECTGPSSGCTEIASGQSGFAQVGFGGGFGAVEVFLGNINHTPTAGNHLLVTLAVAQESTHDVWVEFGSETYPSALLIG